MKHSIISISISLVCMLIVSLTALTVMATGGDGEESNDTSSSVPSAMSSVSSATSSDTSSEVESDVSSDTSSDGAVSSEVSSSDETSSSEGTSSDETSSDETSSEENTSSESSSSGTSSSGGTTSKPGQSSAKPGGGSTFIPESGSEVTVPSAPTPSIDVEEGDEEQLYTPDEETEGVDEEIEEYEGGKVISMSSLVYRYIWIPVLISLLCIGGLIYVNISFKLKYPKSESIASKSGSSAKTKKSGAKRRNSK